MRGRTAVCPQLEALEDRQVFALGVVGADLFATAGGGHRLVADFTQAFDMATVQASDLVINGSATATSVSALDADTLEFQLPALSDAAHTMTLDAGSIQDSLGDSLTAFSRTYTVTSVPQFTVKHNPRLQPGNAPLVGFAGSETDRVDILWQTIPAGAGTQDTFTVDFRPATGNAAWQSATLNSDIATGVQNRVVRSATATGLAWNSDYEYRVRHLRGDVVVNQYQHQFRTRLAAGDESNFTFVAYGDSASGAANGFRAVQSRINQIDPAFAVLLGDNVYETGTHVESDARFSPTVNPEAATWMASHIDYLGLGNHDVSTSSGLPSEQNFSVPIPVAGVTAHAAPPATERPEHSFSWDYGDVHFVTFDTNSLSSSSRLDGLLKWVVADLNASNARWKIVYGHHPLAGVPDKPESPSGNYYQQVVNRLKAAGVDLFMTGHSHTYSWTYPLTGQVNGVATYVDHGHDDHFHAGEGLPQLVSGVGGVGIRTGSFTQFPFVAEGFTSTTPVPARLGFSKIDVTQDELTVSYVAADDGSVIDAFRITKEDTTTKTFQQGVDGYSGTVDTYLHQNTPGTAFGASTTLRVDNDDPSATGLDIQGLLRFENLFGSDPGQIPANAILRSATLQLQTSDGGNSFNLHRMVSDWSASDTWTSRGDGIQLDGVEALAAPDTSTGAVNIGQLSFNVLSSLQAWQSAPASNRGWALVPTGGDGVVFGSSEGTVKPKLIVSYLVDTGVNYQPVANADTAFTTGDTPATIAVLANDTDPNGDVLVVDSVSTPAHGTVLLNADKTITYTPASGYYGTDQFSYTISDGRGGTSTALVDLLVGEVARFQQGLAGYTGTYDTFLQQNAPTVANGSATSLNVDSDEPAGSGLDVQSLLRFDGMFGYGAGQIPAGSVLQSATLKLNVTNGGNSVNLHRMLQSWLTGDTWSSLTNGVLNDGVEATVSPDLATGGVSIGTLSLNVLPSVQAWLAAPAGNHGWALLPTGSDGIDFHSSEGTTPPELTVVYIPPMNFAPVAVADAATLAEDSSTPIAVVANDTDADGDTLSVTSVTVPAHGTAVVSADQTVTYTPNANYFGSDSFSYTIGDGQGGIATGQVTITVTPTSDPPVATADVATVVEDTATPIAVLANDTDADGDTLSVTSVTVPTHGTAVVNTDQTITYTPDANYYGSDSFSYTISDGQGGTATAAVTVTVTAVNDHPAAVGDATTVVEDTATPIAVLTNDTDVDGDTLSVTSVTVPAHGTAVVNANQTVTYTPDANYFGADSFSYTISDGQGGTATAVVTVTVTAVNDHPAAVDDAATVLQQAATSLTVLSNDTDVEGNSLVVQSVTTPAHGTAVVNADQTITYTSAAGYLGADSFSYTISDGQGGTATAQVSITVVSSNQPPVAVADAVTTDEDTPVIVAVLSNDSDPEAGTLTVQSVTVPTRGTAVVNADQTVTYTPNANYFGADSFSYTISDGQGGTATAQVSITVNPVNDSPVANADSVTVREDVSIAIPVMVNDTDPEGQTLTMLSVSVPANGTATRNANGRITYRGKANYFGPDSFTYVISDGNGGTATGQVTVTVTPVNDAPVAVADTAWTTVDLPVSIAVLANDRDVDGDALTISVQAQPTQGTVVVSAQGVATYTPNAGYIGADSFTYRLNDGLANSSIVTVSLSVLGTSKFYVVDRGSDRMFGYNGDGSGMNSSPLGTANRESRGIATDATASRFWSVDLNKTVTVYDAGRNVLGNVTLATVQNPTGIAMAGNDLYVSDSTTRTVFVYGGAANQLTGTVSPTRTIALAAGNTSPQDVATDGTKLWVVNGATVDRVYVYDASTGAALGNWSIDPLNAGPSGITLDPTNTSNSLWIVDRSTDRVYEYTDGRARLSGSQTAAAVFALGVGNRDPQGIADPLGRASRAATTAPVVDVAAAMTKPTAATADASAGSSKACSPWAPAAPIAPTQRTLDPAVVGLLFEADKAGDFYRDLGPQAWEEGDSLE